MPVRRRAGERLPTVWDFETDPQYQSKLDWVEKFMAEELEPLDLVALDPYDKKNADTMAILRPLQRQVKDQGLWAAHLRPELGGQGFGQVKLALLNEIIGRSRWAPWVSSYPTNNSAPIGWWRTPKPPSKLASGMCGPATTYSHGKTTRAIRCFPG